MYRRYVVPFVLAVVIGLGALVITANVQAFTLMPDVFPTNSTTYRLDASYSGLGAAWESRANEAAAHWGANTVFSFVSNAGSSSYVRTLNLGCPASGNVTLANMDPGATAPGIYRASFIINVNTSCNRITWHTGTTSPPMGETDLRTVLRHEFGHAAGLHHVQGANNQLMYGTISPGQLKSILADDINGIAFLYNTSSTVRVTTAESFWTWLGQFKYDNTHGGVGFKGPSFDHIPGCCPLAHNGAMAWSPQTGASSWFPFQGSRIT